MLPVFEEKVLVVAGESWGSNVEQTVLAVRGFDESRLRRKLVAPFLCKDSSSVLTCLVFLRSSEWGEVERSPWRSKVEGVEGVEWERENIECSWGFDYLISRGSVMLTNSSSNLNSVPRCEEWGILGHWVQFRVHFEIHNEWLYLWVPTGMR